MSSTERDILSLLSDLTLSVDYAILGVSLALKAVHSLLRYAVYSKALRKIRVAPELHVSGLRSLLPESDDLSGSSDHQNHDDSMIVMVRGIVKPKSAIDGSRRNNLLVSPMSGDKAVIIERKNNYVYNEWKRILEWKYDLRNDLRSIFRRSSCNQDSSTSLRTVPFVLVENSQQPQSNFVIVNMDDSHQPLPLTTVYHELQLNNKSPYAFLQAFFFPDYPVGMLDEEKILPPGKEISALGICSFENGVLEIKSCNDLPYFLSDLTKDKMLLDVIHQKNVLLWSSIVLGSLSIGLLGYAVVRGWRKWKKWRQEREAQRPSHVSDDEEEDVDGIPDGQLCAVCLVRRRVLAFIPCGHIVCCQPCALSIERELMPKCPICCQTIRGSMRVYYA